MTGSVDKICTQLVLEGASEDLKTHFSRFDANGDGRLTYIELVECLERYNVNLSKDDIFNLHEVNYLNFQVEIMWSDFTVKNMICVNSS